MPRASKKVPVVVVSSDSAKMSDTIPSTEAAVEGALPVDAADSSFAVGAKEAVEGKKLKSPKASRRAKTCDRCDERRKREREYARVSRDRARCAKQSAKAGAESGDVVSSEPVDPSKV